MTEQQDEPTIEVVVVETEYLCGARIGFVAKTVEQAAEAAAVIMTTLCPECRQLLGEPLSDHDREVLSMSPTSHEKARNN